MKAVLLLVLLYFFCVTSAVLLQEIESPASPLAQCSAGSLQFLADFTKPKRHWDHYWETCVGSGHATLALRADWRQHLVLTRKSLGAQFVRFHGLFDDDMSTVLDKGVYSFFNMDSIYDFLVSIGMKPYVELSFMPDALKSGNTTIFHYKGNTSPPKDYSDWAALITAMAQHLIDRYGADEVRSWYFEVWNEPNLGFWSGTQEEYFKLYSYTAKALKAVDSKLKVGGPATAQSQWIPEFKNFVVTNSLPLDFISTHEYPTDITPLQRGILKQVISKAKAEAAPYPVFYSEYNSGLYDPGFHDDPFAAAFVMFNIQDLQGLTHLLSYWTFSDIFEEGGFLSAPFHEGFGMITIHGVPKPVFRAFELLHRTGKERVSVTQVAGSNATAGVYVINNNDQNKGQIMAILYNHNIPGQPIKNESICLQLNGVDLSNKPVFLERIDSTHCNPTATWKQMGSPMYINAEQVATLLKSSQLVKERISLVQNGPTSYSVTVSVPPEGVAAITIG